MVYGIISGVDDATTRAFFRNKKVAEDKVFYACQMSALLQVLRAGDVVYVVDVNRFLTVAQFIGFGRFCMSNGVSIHVLAQPYLDLGNGKQWKPSVENLMVRMVEVERMAKARMTSTFKMTNEQWDYVFRCFEVMNIDILAGIYNADGIMKRSS